MNNKQHLVVIGGGAAGFFTAINAKHPNLSVTILEKSNKVLSKVKVSGGGRCNVTNALEPISTFSKMYPRGANFMKKTLHHFSKDDTIAWFEAKGVHLKVEPDGRMFPVTDDAQTVIDALLQTAAQHKVNVVTNIAVEKILKFEQGFFIHTSKGEIEADVLCIAAGGFPKLSQFDWLNGLGHSIIPPVPSLFTFNLPKHPITKLLGISIPDAVVKIDGTKIKTEGPLLVTHWGLSGPAILKASAYGATALAERNWNFTCTISFLPQMNEDALIAYLIGEQSQHPKRMVANKNSLGFPQRFWDYCLQQVGIPEDLTWANLTAAHRNKLAKLLVAHPFYVQGKTTFKEEFVTAGGIDTAEVHHQSMMSKLHENLYFAGEILNIDGVTGGFNFQNAWTSGWIASQSIISNITQ